jgi:hypothetical protein
MTYFLRWQIESASPIKPWISRRIGQPAAINFFTSDKSWLPIFPSYPDSNRYTIQCIYSEHFNANFFREERSTWTERSRSREIVNAKTI